MKIGLRLAFRLTSCAMSLWIVACQPKAPTFNDSPDNVGWREALLQAGVGSAVERNYPRIAEMSLQQASNALGSCIELDALCGETMLRVHPDLRGEHLKSAWPWALKRASPEVTAELLKRGAVADGRAIEAAMEQPRERAAQRLQVMRLLLLANAPVNYSDFYGETALHHAAREGDAELVSLLISFGADRVRENRKGVTPYQLAMAQGADEAAALLRP